jgi:hypothetical protein
MKGGAVVAPLSFGGRIGVEKGVIWYRVRKVGRAVECTGLVESSAVVETRQM